MVLHAAPSIEALMLNPGNKFHALSGDRKGKYAISINFVEAYEEKYYPIGPPDSVEAILHQISR